MNKRIVYLEQVLEITVSPAETTLLVSRFRLSPRVGYIALAVLGVIGVTVLYTFDPRNPGTYPVCPFLGLTGYHCPGCGTLRALHQLLHGNVIAALGYNPLTVLSLPFIAYSFVDRAMRVFRVKDLPSIFVPHGYIWALFVGIVAFWVLRNVPVEPLTALAP